MSEAFYPLKPHEMNKNVDPDLPLINRIKRGDLEAFEEIVSKYQTRIYNLALNVLRDEMDAQEVAQDIFVAVYTQLHTFEGRSSFYCWLYRIAVNQSLMRKRERKREEEVHAPLEDYLPRFDEEGHHLYPIQDWSRQVEEVVLRGDFMARLSAFIGELPEPYKLAFYLVDIDGLKIEEAAGVLGSSVAAVKSRLHRARLFLRGKLSSYFGRD